VGKRSKLSKLGNSKSYNTVMKARRKNKVAKIIPRIKSHERVRAEKETTKITEGEEKPQMRHRRIKNRTALSRGQKRRKIKKIRNEIRKTIKNKAIIEKPKQEKQIIKQQFDLKEMDDIILDVAQEEIKKSKSAKLSKKQMIQKEREKSIQNN